MQPDRRQLGEGQRAALFDKRQDAVAGRRQFQIVCQCQYVVHGTVARADGNLMAFDDAVQIVFEKLRIEPPRKLDSAECGRGVRKPAAGKFVAQEGIVEFAVVRQ